MKIRVSLAYKVIAAFLIVTLPIAAAFFYTYRNSKIQLERLILDDLASSAESRELEVLLFLEMAKNRVTDFASDDFIVTETEKLLSGTAGPKGLSDYLTKNKLPLVENFYRITVMTRDGRIRASTLSDIIGEDRSEDDFFKNGMKGPSVTESPRGYMERPELVVSAPVHSRKTGETVGVISGVMPIERFASVFTGEQAKELGAKTWRIMGEYETAEIYLVNRDRLMLTPSIFIEEAVMKQRVDTRPVRACLERGVEVTGFYDDYRGVEVAGSSMCFEPFGWTLLVEVDKEEAFKPVNRISRYAAISGLIVIGLIGALVIFFLRVVVAQLRGLTAAASEVASGNYGITIPVRTGDEIGALSESFNHMAGEIKERSEALRETEERLRAILDNTTQVVYLKDTEGRYILVNREFEKLFHMSLDGLRGRTDHEIFPKETADAFRENDLKVVEKNKVMEFEETAVVDGERRYYISVKFPLRDASGAPYAVGGISTDITVRRLAEEALRKSEASLANAQRIARLGNWNWDIQTNELRWSEEIFAIFDIPRGQGTSYDTFMNRVHPEDRGFVQKAIDDALYRGKPYSIDHRIILSDGAERIIHEEAEVVFNGYGNPVMMSGTCQDITERKRAEEEVRTLNRELERRVLERTEQLEAANRELESFSYSAAHDLRTPLRLVDGFSKTLLRDYAAKLDERGRDYLKRVRDASARMGMLIEDLMNLSHVMRAEMRLEDVDLSALAREVCDNLKRSQPEREVEIIVEEGLRTKADGRLLRIVLENLIGNAWKFTSKKERAEIELGDMGEEDGKTVFFVRDNGAGFDMKYAERLFGAFQRLHSADDFPGTGVGLATVQRIIKRHGGRVWAKSAAGEGATFYFTL